MRDWMMAGVWRLTLRLPEGIGWKRVRQLAERAREVVGEVSPEHRAVHHFVVRELPRFGRPMPPQHIADSLDLPSGKVVEILTELEARKGFLFRNEDGAVVWAYPVTAETTPHRIRLRSGETLYAAWAADAIATPFVQGQLRNEPVSVTVETECVHCSEPMTLHVDNDMNVSVEPSEAVPMVFTPDVETWDTEAPSIVDDFWRENVFLWSEDHAREYRKKAHRVRGVYSPLHRVAEGNKIVQSAIFGFDISSGERWHPQLTKALEKLRRTWWPRRAVRSSGDIS